MNSLNLSNEASSTLIKRSSGGKRERKESLRCQLSWDSAPSLGSKSKATKPSRRSSIATTTRKQRLLSLDSPPNSGSKSKATKPSRRASIATTTRKQRLLSLDSRSGSTSTSKASQPESTTTVLSSTAKNQLLLSLDFAPCSGSKSKATRPPQRASTQPKITTTKKQRLLSVDSAPSLIGSRSKPSRRASIQSNVTTARKQRQLSLDSTSLELCPKATQPNRRASTQSTATKTRTSGTPAKPDRAPKRSVNRTKSLDVTMSPKAEPNRGNLSKRSFSAPLSPLGQILEHNKGKSKVKRRSASTDTLPVAPLTSRSNLEKPKKILRFHDRLRYKKSVSYAKVDADSIWYSPAEILELREEEQEVQRGLAVGYARACRDANLLNVEGLLTAKERQAMALRRVDSKQAVASFQASREGYMQVDDIIAKEYASYSNQASRAARKRANRLSSHVYALWNPYEDNSDDDETWNETEIEPSVTVEMPPSVMQKRSSLSFKLPRTSSLSSTSTALTSRTSSTKSFGDDGGEMEDQPTGVWYSFRRRVPSCSDMSRSS
ncbi:unnamed protein product [Cylindrotheca closterium]|uniref:Uncharacterized protein n=1 Tax=Cylindrotheca closterium TaxID=2856 RepID=A0AAD2CFU6_9STRA|nr:unnamed protein product [Cylindrotheca closterium]